MAEPNIKPTKSAPEVAPEPAESAPEVAPEPAESGAKEVYYFPDLEGHEISVRATSQEEAVKLAKEKLAKEVNNG